MLQERSRHGESGWRATMFYVASRRDCDRCALKALCFASDRQPRNRAPAFRFVIQTPAGTLAGPVDFVSEFVGIGGSRAEQYSKSMSGLRNSSARIRWRLIRLPIPTQ